MSSETYIGSRAPEIAASVAQCLTPRTYAVMVEYATSGNAYTVHTGRTREWAETICDRATLQRADWEVDELTYYVMREAR